MSAVKALVPLTILAIKLCKETYSDLEGKLYVSGIFLSIAFFTFNIFQGN